MKTRFCLFLFFILLMPAGVCQARTNIPLVKDVPKGSGNDDRARDPGAPEVWLDDAVLTIDFIFESPTRVAIRHRTTQALIYVEYFSSTTHVSVNLEELHIEAGEYQLQVSFCGFWWSGYFLVDEDYTHVAKGERYVKLDGTFYRLDGDVVTTVRPEEAGGLSRYASFCWQPDYPTHIAIPDEVFLGGEAYPVVGIERGTFRYCYELVSILLPPTVTYIGNVSFKGCSKLEQVTIPESVRHIGIHAFFECRALRSIDIPEGVEVIKEGAFQGCTSLTRISLPSTMVRIKNYAFSDISTLTHVYCHASVPFAISEHAFNYHCILHVPQGCRDAYLEAEGWNRFAIVVDDITGGVFSDETGLTPVVGDADADAPGRLFDLQGRPAEGSQPGIYIMGGKKVRVQ